MNSKRAKVIVNPAAGANSTHRKWPRISAMLKRAGLLFDHQYTEGAGHAIELARDAAGDGYHCLVSVGGDGTVNEVANGILASGNGAETALGIISTGTGSDFARSAGIPRDYAAACSSVVGDGCLSIDVGLVECRKDGQTVRRFFLNGAGIGFDAAVSERSNRMSKRLGGTIPYLAALFRTLASYHNKPVRLSVGERTVNGKVLSVVVSNGKYFGGGMKVAPDASLTDGLLDVVTVGDIGKLNLIKSLPMIYKGTHGRHPKVTLEQAVSVTVTSDERLPVHADGELIGEGPASFSIKSAALNIIV